MEASPLSSAPATRVLRYTPDTPVGILNGSAGESRCRKRKKLGASEGGNNACAQEKNHQRAPRPHPESKLGVPARRALKRTRLVVAVFAPGTLHRIDNDKIRAVL
ncbi:hypothetical protein MTO96_011597 [Rhipicephalus appendiculatus]